MASGQDAYAAVTRLPEVDRVVSTGNGTGPPVRAKRYLPDGAGHFQRGTQGAASGHVPNAGLASSLILIRALGQERVAVGTEDGRAHAVGMPEGSPQPSRGRIPQTHPPISA